ncbi:MAG: YceD family protein [Mycobacteriales bacterium]
MKTKPISSLDPRAPLVLDTRELGRRPGSMRRLRRTAPAPGDLLVGMVGIPEGAGIELDLRLESVMEGVLVSGTARTRVTGECARCLDPVAGEVEVELQELYAYPHTDAEGDEELLRLDGDLLDLEPMVTDALVLELPLSPRCDDDCPGLCPTCGVRLAGAEPDHGHESTDPRWAALQGLQGLPELTDLRTTDSQEN